MALTPADTRLRRREIVAVSRLAITDERGPMNRSAFPSLALATLLAAGCASTSTTQAVKPMDVVETGIPDLQRALADKRITSRELVVLYLTRIALYEDQVKAIMVVNPKVLAEADALDRERAQGKIRGPLHG